MVYRFVERLKFDFESFTTRSMFQLVTCYHQQLMINSASAKIHHSNMLPVSELIVIDANL